MQMRNAERLSLAEMAEFIQASQEIEFDGENRQEIYAWVQVTVISE